MTQRPLFPSAWRFRGYEGTASAKFSPCRAYRYELRRVWKRGAGALIVIACNPSTADETVEDTTIRRLLGFAECWGLGQLVMLNVFAFRATDPAVMRRAYADGVDVVGPENDATIERVLCEHHGSKLLLAWGNHGRVGGRGTIVGTMALRFHGKPECFGLTSERQPIHPLYQPGAATPRLYVDCLAEAAGTTTSGGHR